MQTKKFDSRWAKRMSEIQTNLKLYDQAVLGNSSSGNSLFSLFILTVMRITV
jgi:hypothetical protein